MQRKHFALLALFLIAFVGTAVDANETKSTFPRVSRVSATFSISWDSPHVYLGVFSEKGIPLYGLVCHPGDFVDAEGGDYDNLFHCKLKPLDTADPFDDLFYPSVDWRRARTRALFDADQINGRCRNHPFYGARRVFLTRGMRVTLAIRDYSDPVPLIAQMKALAANPNSQTSRYRFRLDVEIVPDARAKLPHAASVPEECWTTYQLKDKNRIVVKKHIGADPAWPGK